MLLARSRSTVNLPLVYEFTSGSLLADFFRPTCTAEERAAYAHLSPDMVACRVAALALQ
eukprot:COSAG01_NODE_2962_length_6786_cov_21.580544_11_plen_59_part_00